MTPTASSGTSRGSTADTTGSSTPYSSTAPPNETTPSPEPSTTSTATSGTPSTPYTTQQKTTSVAGMVELADTPPSKGGAARHEGSNPSPRTDPAQQIHDWNTSIFADAKQKREDTFDALLRERKKPEPRENMPTLF